jgi:uncharacterized circularly permuted ATP-grasp superfamily protein
MSARLAGRRVDALWRWIDTNSLDPLISIPLDDGRSRSGRLLDRGHVAMANWPGVEVVEAPAFAAFLPRLFKTCWTKNRCCPMSRRGGAGARPRPIWCASVWVN